MASFEDLTGVDNLTGALLHPDGSYEESSLYCNVTQGNYGDENDFLNALDEGVDGWEPVRGLSNQYGLGAENFLMHTDEFFGSDAITETLLKKNGPGHYVSVSVVDEDDFPSGWVLLYHP